MTILIQLENYYRESGILSTDFRCKHLAKCRGCLRPTPVDATTPEEAEDTFTEAKAAFVGDRYCECAPRLLFVSLDPGGALKPNDPKYNYISPESRTLSGVWKGNARIMQCFIKGKSIPRPRLEGTNQVAEAILREFPDIPQGEHAMRFYAHVNAAKCTTNKGGRKQANEELFKNCREYLQGEINALCPDIIVTHGGKARRGVKHAFRGSTIEKNAYPNVWVITPKSGSQIFWLNTYHPTARYRANETQRPFDLQMEGLDGGPRSDGNSPGLDGYAKLIHNFISNRDSRPPSPAF